ncbi:MAG: sigma-70 family RNA polymerase sigma factor [Dysgonamonadaceae bacterium]|jgi:RNA polymerase sigma-70 factor (ECF subfamily)|nr:sigma-70 family RNA polymerase sigma factor [Dysgonamonadaceae bacterium]
MNQVEKRDYFIEVVQTHKGIIYKIANAYCRCAEDREDLVQEILIQLWKSLDIYSDRYRFSTWLYRIALNISISFYRKSSIRKSLFSGNLGAFLNFPDRDENDETESNIALLYRFISEFNDLDKALIILYLEEKSYKEIAFIIGISETNVATKISRLKKLLRKKFSDNGVCGS